MSFDPVFGGLYFRDYFSKLFSITDDPAFISKTDFAGKQQCSLQPIKITALKFAEDHVSDQDRRLKFVQSEHSKSICEELRNCVKARTSYSSLSRKVIIRI